MVHHAAQNNQKDMLSLLIEAKADLNKQCKAQSTPLHYAVRKEADAAIRLLLRNGADTSIRNSVMK